MGLQNIIDALNDKDPKPNKFTRAMGELIKKAREDAELSQNDLAEVINRRRATLTDLESGKHELDATTLALIAVALNKPIMYFFPRNLANIFPKDDLSTSEQELIMIFRQLQFKELEEVAMNQIRSLAEYDAFETLENIVDLSKERIEIIYNLKKLKNK